MSANGTNLTVELTTALVAAQAEMPAVAKDATNPHFHSKFVSLDALIAKTRPVLVKHGLALTQFPASSDSGDAVLRTILVHGPSGGCIANDTPLFLTKGDMQGLGSAITYARRYAWASVLGIASEEDDDGNVASGESIGREPDRASDGRQFAPAEAPDGDPGAYVMPFGKHRGVRVDAIERGYLEWLVGNSNKADIVAIVQAYLSGNGKTLETALNDGDIPF